MELDAAGLPVPESAPEVELGRIRLGSSSLVVRLVVGERGGESMPLVDIREYVEPRRAESERYRAPKNGKTVRKPRSDFEGFTRKGFRFTVESAEILAEALARAAVTGATLEGAA